MGLRKLLGKSSKTEKPQIPENTPATCSECKWKGIISDCSIEIDSEGWEYPDYEVLVCPACGEYSVDI